MDISKFLSQIASSKWFMHNDYLMAYGVFLNAVMEGKINLEETKGILDLFATTPENKTISLQSAMAENGDSIQAAFDKFPEGSTLVVPLKGTMMKYDTWWSYGTEFISQFIKQAGDHENIKSIILDVDSGGGTVDSISPMLDVINYARSKKPVVGLANTAASAAYYAISATDLIIASNDVSSEFGSIGVMLSFLDIMPMWEKMGVKRHVIYAPESDYKNLDFENALKGDYELMKTETLSPLAKKFQSDVRKYRSGKVDITQKGILNGRMFYAKDAIKYGLADEIGNLDYAVKRAGQLADKR